MNSKKDDFLNLELDQTQFSGGRMILSLFDRMFELYRFQYNIKSNISAIRDNEGNLIYEVNQGFDVQAITMGSLFDYTDDRTDPLKGVRFNYNYAIPPKGFGLRRFLCAGVQPFRIHSHRKKYDCLELVPRRGNGS